MTKSIVIAAVVSFGMLFSVIVQGSEGGTGAPNGPVGLWKTYDSDGNVESLVQVVERNGVLRATVTKVLASGAENGNAICTWCKGERKDRSIVGMSVMGGMKKDGNEWSGGWVYDPRRDLKAKCKIELIDGGQTLKVRGYLMTYLIGETRYWKRIR